MEININIEWFEDIQPEILEELNENARARAFEQIMNHCIEGELYELGNVHKEYRGWWTREIIH